MKCKFPPCTNEAKENPYRGHTPVFCSVKCKNKHGVNQLRKRRKDQLVEMLGGACSRCGYTGPSSAFDFHHRDPSLKEFSINRGVTLSWSKIEKEIEKCDLLCANCHRIIHSQD